MKDLKLCLPFALFTIYTLVSLFKGATIADAAITLSIAGIFGLSLWITTTKIIMNKPLDEETEKQLKIVERLRIQREIHQLQNDMAKMSGGQNQQVNPPKPFSF